MLSSDVMGQIMLDIGADVPDDGYTPEMRVWRRKVEGEFGAWRAGHPKSHIGPDPGLEGMPGDDDGGRRDNFSPGQPRDKDGKWAHGGAGAAEAKVKTKYPFKLTQIGEKEGNWTGAGKGGGHVIQEKGVDGQWKTVSSGHSEVSAHGQVLHAAVKLKKEYRVISAESGGFSTLHVGAGGNVVAGTASGLASTYAKRLTTNYKSVQWHKENDPKIKAAKAALPSAPAPVIKLAIKTKNSEPDFVAAGLMSPEHAKKIADFEQKQVVAKKVAEAEDAKAKFKAEIKAKAQTNMVAETKTPAPFADHFSTLAAVASKPNKPEWSQAKIAAKEAAKKVLEAHKNAKTLAELKAAADALEAVGNKAASAGSMWGKEYHSLASQMRAKAEPAPATAPVNTSVPTASARPIASIKGVPMPLSTFQTARTAYTHSLTQAEKSAALSYSNSTYVAINGALRKGKPHHLMNDIDSALAKAPAPHDMVVYRGTSAQTVKKILGMKIKPGDQFTEKTYMSTSASETSAFHKTHKLIITVPKGYPAAPIPSYHDHENEILIRRNTKYQVTKIDGHDIHVTVVHDGDVKNDGSPNQPRDKNGEWSHGGGGGATKQMAPVTTHATEMTPGQRAAYHGTPPNPGKPSGPDAATRAEKPVTAAKTYVQTNRPAGGSQGGKWYKDEGGAEYFGKSYHGDMSRLGAEHAANQIYRTMGVKAPETHVATIEGKPVLMSKEIKGTDGDKVHVSKLHEAGITKGFVVDAWLGNRDVVGLTHDNVKISPSGVARIDNGSVFHHRAMGGAKEFGPNVGELDSMRNPKYTAGKIFSKISDAELHEQMKDFTTKYAEKREEIHGILQKSGMPAHEVAQVGATLDARAADIARRAAKP